MPRTTRISRTLRIAAIFALMVLHATAHAQTAQAKPATLDAVVRELGNAFVHEPHHVGLSIGVIDNGARHTWHFGSIDRATQQVPNDRSIYEIASITKTYTGILLAQAIIDDKIDLTDDVRKYLPESYPNLAYRGYPVRIMDLATHTAGLPKQIRAFRKGATAQQIIDAYGNYSEAQFLQDLEQVQIADFPGTTFAYSNVDAQLLGIVLERVYKMSYGELVAKYITRPHDMPDTVLTLNADQRERMVKEYGGDGKRMPEMTMWRNIPAAGSLKSTIADQLNYLQWNLDSYNQAVALSYRAMYTDTPERDDDIGLFWFSHTLPGGGSVVRHTGGSFGSVGYIAVYPAAKFGIVILANDAGDSTETDLVKLGDAIVGKTH